MSIINDCAAAISEECAQKIRRIVLHRPKLSPESIATALHDYAMRNHGSALHYLDVAERRAANGLPLPWEPVDIKLPRIVLPDGSEVDPIDVLLVMHALPTGDIEIAYTPTIDQTQVKPQDHRAWVRMNHKFGPRR